MYYLTVSIAQKSGLVPLGPLLGSFRLTSGVSKGVFFTGDWQESPHKLKQAAGQIQPLCRRTEVPISVLAASQDRLSS